MILMFLTLNDVNSSFTGRSNQPNGWLDDHVKQNTGGAYRDRTDDLLNANQALSQLS
jgi:hypothetical protein